jgi:YHS domain-containing protein
MRPFLALLSCLALSTGLLIAAEVKKPEAKKPATQPTTQPSKPINKNCAVMQDHEADQKVTYVYKDKTYAFCCSECIPEFKKNPEKFKNAK